MRAMRFAWREHTSVEKVWLQTNKIGRVYACGVLVLWWLNTSLKFTMYLSYLCKIEGGEGNSVNNRRLACVNKE